jgi:hypothetical protein
MKTMIGQEIDQIQVHLYLKKWLGLLENYPLKSFLYNYNQKRFGLDKFSTSLNINIYRDAR